MGEDTGASHSLLSQSPAHTGLGALGRRVARSLLPLRIRNYIIGNRQLRQYSLSNRRFYQPLVSMTVPTPIGLRQGQSKTDNGAEFQSAFYYHVLDKGEQ